MRILAMTAAAMVLLAGCATDIMSEKECLAGDWYGAGLEDGRLGLTEDALDERIAACGQYGVSADARAYFDGRDAALRQLCTFQGGAAYGQAGDQYLGVCGRETEDVFLSGYLPGRRVHLAELDRNAAEDVHRNALADVENAREDARRARARMEDPAASEEEIENARADLRRARNRAERSEREVDDALYELGRADEALDRAISGQASWRRSEEYYALRDAIAEAHEFARAEDAIAHCTDELPYFTPRCFLRGGGALTDARTGEVCAYGPGEAVLARRGPGYRNGDVAGSILFFDFFPADPASGRVASRSAGSFEVLFGPGRAYDGVSCR